MAAEVGVVRVVVGLAGAEVAAVAEAARVAVDSVVG